MFKAESCVFVLKHQAGGVEQNTVSEEARSSSVTDQPTSPGARRWPGPLRRSTAGQTPLLNDWFSSIKWSVIINIFTVITDMLNKSIYFQKLLLSPNFWAVVYITLNNWLHILWIFRWSGCWRCDDYESMYWSITRHYAFWFIAFLSSSGL